MSRKIPIAVLGLVLLSQAAACEREDASTAAYLSLAALNSPKSKAKTPPAEVAARGERRAKAGGETDAEGTAKAEETAEAEETESPTLVAARGRRLAKNGACPADMVLVEGDYCPDVQLNCRKYMDPEGRYEQFRCAEYGPSTCKSKARKHMRYCIDRHEYVPPGEALPANFKSFTHAERICKEQGRRVCMESEWNFACEGEDMRPYPYGFKRDAEACNADRMDILTDTGKLRDLRATPGSHPRCASPFGVQDLSGNLEEFVAIDRTNPVRPAMKGAYWQPGRNFCRAAQTAHDRYYNGTETGFRCCAEAR